MQTHCGTQQTIGVGSHESPMLTLCRFNMTQLATCLLYCTCAGVEPMT